MLATLDKTKLITDNKRCLNLAAVTHCRYILAYDIQGMICCRGHGLADIYFYKYICVNIVYFTLFYNYLHYM